MALQFQFLPRFRPAILFAREEKSDIALLAAYGHFIGKGSVERLPANVDTKRLIHVHSLMAKALLMSRTHHLFKLMLSFGAITSRDNSNKAWHIDSLSNCGAYLPEAT